MGREYRTGIGCTPDALTPEVVEDLELGAIRRSPDGFTIDKLAPHLAR
jgi:hypothetical protein